MAIAQRLVSINPAFLREIKEDHHELRQLIHHTSAMLDRGNTSAKRDEPAAIADRDGPVEIDIPRLVEMLTRLRDQLAMHFSLEEAYGYFEDAITVAPHLCRRAETLRGQHFDLFAELCRLVESAEGLRYEQQPERLLARVTENYHAFLAKFREHESLECDLILEAFNDDIGTGD
jgi:hypothetical protein